MGSSDVTGTAFDTVEGRRRTLPFLMPRSSGHPERSPLPRLLLVEPNEARRAHWCHVAETTADIDAVADFLTARTRLLSEPYDWVATNLCLGEYNGLHLLHLAAAARLQTRLLVYADPHAPWLAEEALRGGAFSYASADGLGRALSHPSFGR